MPSRSGRRPRSPPAERILRPAGQHAVQREIGRLQSAFAVQVQIDDEQFGRRGDGGHELAVLIVIAAEARRDGAIHPAGDASHRRGVADRAFADFVTRDARLAGRDAQRRKRLGAELVHERHLARPNGWIDRFENVLRQRLAVACELPNGGDGPGHIGAQPPQIDEAADDGEIDLVIVAGRDEVGGDLHTRLHAPDRAVALEGFLAKRFVVLRLAVAAHVAEHHFKRFAIAAMCVDHAIELGDGAAKIGERTFGGAGLFE